MAGIVKRRDNFKIITGVLTRIPKKRGDDNAADDDDDDDEEEDDDQEPQWLDSSEMNDVASGAHLAEARNVSQKEVFIIPFGSDKKVPVQGKFLLCDPWWEAEIKTFIDTVSQHGKKLNFEELEDVVRWFGNIKPEYKPIAEMIARKLHGTEEGMYLVRALKFPNLIKYLPSLLPNHAGGILTKQDDDNLQKLEEDVVGKPWVFGFGPILGWDYNLVGCEAYVDSFHHCSLFQKIPPHIQDALYIYHVMKKDSQSFGHTFLYENSMKKSRAFPSDYRVRHWEKAYKFLEENYIIVREKNRRYLRKYWKYEQLITDNLIELQSRSQWEIDFDWRGHEDFQSDKIQQRAARMICENPVTVMSGKGGCGKTHVVSRVFEAAARKFLPSEEEKAKEENTEEDEGKDQLESDKKEKTILKDPYILLTAPTGKAAHLLGRRSHLPAYTLHQVMYSFFGYIRAKNKASSESKGSASDQPEEWKFKVVHALIVDECSMVSIQVFSTVLDILMRESKLCKVVFLGDINQLPSIQPGNFLSDLYRSYSAIGWSVSLLTNHRAESTAIVENATRISMQEEPQFDPDHGFHDVRIRSSQMDETLNDTTFLSETQQEEESFEIDGAIRSLLGKDDPSIQDHERSQFIAFRRKDCARINELCCKFYSAHTTRNTKKKLDFRPGDKICMSRNADVYDMITKKDVRLCNGEIFFIKDWMEKIDGRKKTVEVMLKEGDRMLHVDFREVRRKCKVKHSWARTIHTYQGSESESVIYVVGSSGIQNWQHVYTAVTRGKNQVYIVSSPQQLGRAIAKKPHQRNTRLRELLNKALKQGGQVGSGGQSSQATQGQNLQSIQLPFTQNWGLNASCNGEQGYTQLKSISSPCQTQVEGSSSSVMMRSELFKDRELVKGEDAEEMQDWGDDSWDDESFVSQVFECEKQMLLEAAGTGKAKLPTDNSSTNETVATEVGKPQASNQRQVQLQKHTQVAKSFTRSLFPSETDSKGEAASKQMLESPELQHVMVMDDDCDNSSEDSFSESESDLSTLTSTRGTDTGKRSETTQMPDVQESPISDLGSQLQRSRIFSPQRSPKRPCDDSPGTLTFKKSKW